MWQKVRYIIDICGSRRERQWRAEIFLIFFNWFVYHNEYIYEWGRADIYMLGRKSRYLFVNVLVLSDQKRRSEFGGNNCWTFHVWLVMLSPRDSSYYTASVNVEFDASRELNHNSIDSTLTIHNYHFILQHLCLSCEHELGFIWVYCDEKSIKSRIWLINVDFFFGFS